jgi:hypothetical protein
MNKEGSTVQSKEMKEKKNDIEIFNNFRPANSIRTIR